MKEKKFLRCICCGGFTLHRLKGFWVHKHCEEELKHWLMLYKYEMPLIVRDLMLKDFMKAFNAWLQGGDKFENYRNKLWRKARKILIKKHGKPSWVIKQEGVSNIKA